MQWISERIIVSTFFYQILFYMYVLCVIIFFCFEQGFDPSVQDSHSQDQYSFLDSLANGLTPMHWACAMSSENTVTALLSHQGNLVNSLTWQHLTPLHVGACVGSVELCEKLIKEGAMVRIREMAQWF